MCNSQNAAVQHLNMKFDRLNRITNVLQRDVEDIWTVLSNTVIKFGNLGDFSNETGKATADEVFQLVNETVFDVKELKTEVEDLIFSVKNGLMKEKAFNNRAIKEITKSQQELKAKLTDEISGVKNWLQSFEVTQTQNLRQMFEKFNSDAKKDNTIFEQKVQNITDELEVTLEQNANSSDRQAAKLKDEIVLIKSVINDKHVLVCDEGWESFGTHCYYLSSDSKTWDEALDFCKSKKSHMVEIDNKVIVDFLIQQCKGGVLWVGANDRETEGRFVWQNSKKPVSPELFYKNEPNNKLGNEHCAQFYCNRNGTLNDNRCDRTMNFVCQHSKFIFQ